MGEWTDRPAVSRALILVALAAAAYQPVCAACTDSDGDGYYAEAGCGTAIDCSDRAPATHPGALEACNGFDDTCDGSVDEGCLTSCGNPMQRGEIVDVDVPPWSDESPSVAWTGSQYGVAWVQYGMGEPPNNPHTVRLARLSASGELLGQTQVSEPGFSEYPVGLVWTGSEYSLAWHDSEVYFRRVGPDGNTIGTSLRVSDSDPSASRYPALAWTGREYGIVWYDERAGARQVYFARLDAGGNKIGSDTPVGDPGTVATGTQAIAWDGSTFGIAWNDSRSGNPEIYFARISATGTKVGTDIRVTSDSASSYRPTLVWNGTAFGVAWFDDRDGSFAAYFALLDRDGQKLAGDLRVPDPGTHFTDTVVSPILAWTGSEWNVGWTDDRSWLSQVYLGRLDAGGAKIGRDQQLTRGTGRKYWPGAARDGVGFGLAWVDASIPPYRVRFARFACCNPVIDGDGDGVSQCEDCDDSNLAIRPAAVETCNLVDDDCDGVTDEGLDLDGDGVTPCQGDCNDADPAIDGRAEIPCTGIDEACDGPSNDAPDDDGDGWDVCGPADSFNPDSLARDPNDHDPLAGPGAAEICFNGIDDDGDGMLDEGCATACASPQRVGPERQVTDGPGNSWAPSLGWAGDAWGLGCLTPSPSYRSGYLQRIERSGGMLGSPRRLTETAPWAAAAFALAWTGADYGACWIDYRESERGEVYVRTADPGGDLLGGIQRTTEVYSSKGLPSVVWNGRAYGVAWIDARSGTPALYFAEVDALGRKISQEIALGDAVGAVPSSDLAPSLVWTGSEYAVAWRDASPGNGEIFVARVDGNGSRIGAPVRITNDSANSFSPSLAWTGTGYGLAWSDARSGGTSNVYFARLNSLGAKVGSDVKLTSASYPRYDRNPSLTWTGSEFGLVWQDFSVQSPQFRVRFSRLNASGTRIGTDVTITGATSGDSWMLDLAWSGAEYGLAWYDSRTGDNEVYFASILCCGEDRDGDGAVACDDCDDLAAAAHPGATEICDGLDNNCDGAIDEGFPIPGIVSGLVFDADRVTLRWNADPSADRYDVVKGALEALRSSGGDYSTAVSECRANDLAAVSLVDVALPAPGGAVFYLTRTQAACNSGTYDSGAASQVRSRDGGIAASAAGCP
jgi:hypothetical protein